MEELGDRVHVDEVKDALHKLADSFNVSLSKVDKACLLRGEDFQC